MGKPQATRMPVGFIGHGNPLNVAVEERFAPWRQWGHQLPRPGAVLAVSAHWEATPVTIGRIEDHTEILYDFNGFPEWMYRLQYPAPGAPDLADRVEALLQLHTDVERADRPIDHGAWIPLIHMWPEADIPLLQISMPLDMSEEALYELGGELSPLRDEGVLILATGNLVHNLRGMSPEDIDPPEYIRGFDTWVSGSLKSRDHAALQVWRQEAPEALHSHPSAEHYRPVLVAAGAARRDEVRFPVVGFEHGTIARRSVQFD